MQTVVHQGQGIDNKILTVLVGVRINEKTSQLCNCVSGYPESRVWRIHPAVMALFIEPENNLGWIQTALATSGQIRAASGSSAGPMWARPSDGPRSPYRPIEREPKSKLGQLQRPRDRTTRYQKCSSGALYMLLGTSDVVVALSPVR